MSKRLEPDTEPDDAFSLVLGDVNNSPLMRHDRTPASEQQSLQAPLPPEAASPTVQPPAPQQLHSPAPPLASPVSSVSAGAFAMPEDLFREPVSSATQQSFSAGGEHREHAREPDAPRNMFTLEQACYSGQGLHPWLEVQLDTCTVRPDTDLTTAADEASLEALRHALLAASEQEVAVVRLDLARQSLSPRVLALALACSRHLRKNGKARLVLANCPETLHNVFQVMRLQARHDIAYS